MNIVLHSVREMERNKGSRFTLCVWVAIEERKTKRFVFPTLSDKDVG